MQRALYKDLLSSQNFVYTSILYNPKLIQNASSFIISDKKKILQFSVKI